jgi:hypothetical protein
VGGERDKIMGIGRREKRKGKRGDELGERDMGGQKRRWMS